ncbi:hypothetical protein QBC40DRAFT_290616, partial [Triangularia verruculosa]
MNPAATPDAAMNAQDDSALARMPVEVLLRITRFVPTVDLSNVRLTCRVIERNLFNFFAHEFFRKKQFMVSTPSLQALIDISNHHSLSPFLKHVIICTDRLAEIHGYQQPTDPQKRQNFRRAHADQANLLSTGLLRDMLAEAFSALPNLEVIDLRDFYSRTRNRDGVNAEWRSYGSRMLRESTGVAVNATASSSGLYDTYPTQIFTAITAALATSERQPNSIEVLLRHRNWGLFDHAFAIPSRLEPKLAPILANLKTLHLTLCINYESFMIQDFLAMARNVSWLRLNFNYVSRVSMDQEPGPMLLKWVAHPESDTPISDVDRKSIPFPNLIRFDIGNADLTARTIVKLVTKFSPTLEHLSMRRVILFGTTREREEKLNPWEGLFNSMKKIRGILRVLELSELQHSSLDPGNFPGSVAFQRSSDSPTLEAHSSFMGTTDRMSFEALIQTINDRMICRWPGRHNRGTWDVEMEVDSEEVEEDENEDEDEDEDENEDEDLDED